MAQELQFRTTDANTWKGLERIQLKISKRDKKMLTRNVVAVEEIGHGLAHAHAYAVPMVMGKSYLGAELGWGVDYEGKIEGYSIFPRVDIKRIEWGVPEPKDTFPTTLSRNEMFKKEQEAFLRLKPSLLGQETYINKFVAVLGGKVVDFDTDIRNLAKRVYSKYGYVPTYIEKVQKERTAVELPSPER